MSKALDCALSLTEEFHKAQYLDDVDPKTVKALAVLVGNVLDPDENDRVLKALAKVDPSIDISDLSPETLEDHPQLTKEQGMRLMFWTIALIGALMQLEEPGFAPDPADEGKAAAMTKEWAEEMRKDLEATDPAFARYVFGGPGGPR
jgi:hypothetical protein